MKILKQNTLALLFQTNLPTGLWPFQVSWWKNYVIIAELHLRAKRASVGGAP